jgi:phosphonate transport system substrate-binding protein
MRQRSASGRQQFATDRKQIRVVHDRFQGMPGHFTPRFMLNARLYLTVLSCLLLSLGTALAQRQPAPFIIALKPDKDPDAMLAERQNLASMLSAELGRPVNVIVPLSGAVIVEGLANGTIDVAYISATDMLNARRSGAATLLLAGEIDGRTWYRSYWIALKEKSYRSIHDLRGLPVAFSSRTSTSGYVVPLHDLYTQGLISERGSAEEFFGSGHVWFGSGYVSAVERVLRREAEAAAVSDYVLDEDKHLSPEQRAQLRKIDEQGPVPTHVLAAGRRLSDSDRGRLQRAFLALNQPEHDDLRQHAFVSRLVKVDETEHLRPLAEALALAQQGR